MIKSIKNISKREKIIIGLVILAILYGLFELLSPPAKEDNYTGPGEDNKALNELVAGIDRVITGEGLTQGEQYILASAQDEWPQDPFSDVPLDMLEGGEKGDIEEEIEDMQISETGQVFTYSGFLVMGDKRIAIIDGQEYEKGDELKSGLYTVQDIDPEKVSIRDNKASRVIIVPIQDKYIEGKNP
jgi:hypothetical protein